jgi:hypothetical protein
MRVDLSGKRKWVAGAAAALVVAGGGVAVGANTFGSPKEERQAVIADAAKQLGIAPAKLSDALNKALENRVDAAVAAGRLSKAEGEALKARIEAGDAPLFPGGRPHGFGHHRGFGHHGPKLDTVATYLGVTEEQLRTELESGKTLAQIAKDHGKTADGLVGALVDAAGKRLDEAVKAGRLTRAEADAMLTGLKARITDFVNGRFPRPPDGDGDHHGFRGGRGAFFGPPPGPPGP